MANISFPRNVTCLQLSDTEIHCHGLRYEEYEAPLSISDKMFWIYLGLYVVLVLFAGLMSGLTMGLLSLDVSQLEILMKAGKPQEQKYAEKIYPIVKKHHLLLVTLLLANAVAVETMPICMDKIAGSVTAIIVSVTAVLLFGEVIPQALCTRYGLAIGAHLSWLVKFFIFLLFIIAWPLSKLLDCLIGESHETFFRRAELKELVDKHRTLDEENEEPLTMDEALIIKGALDLKHKTALDAYVPLENVYMLSSDAVLDRDTMKEVIQYGHSRVPVYEGDRTNIIGLFLVKSQIILDPDDCTPITTVMRNTKSIPRIYAEEPLYNLLNTFQTGRSHICVVVKVAEGAGNQVNENTIGIITLEDVIEEILQEEIIDETDVYVDVAKRVRVARLKQKRSRAMSNPMKKAKKSSSLPPPPASLPSISEDDYSEKKPLLE